MAMSARKQAACSQKAMFMLNLTAVMLIALAVPLLFVDLGLAGEGGGRWFDLAMAVAGGAVMIGALIASLRRGPEEDEYARRLVAQAAVIGFYATMTAFVVWRPLAGSWVAAPTGDQMMALLFASTGLGFFIARARGVW